MCSLLMKLIYFIIGLLENEQGANAWNTWRWNECFVASTSEFLPCGSRPIENYTGIIPLSAFCYEWKNDISLWELGTFLQFGSLKNYKITCIVLWFCKLLLILCCQVQPDIYKYILCLLFLPSSLLLDSKKNMMMMAK